MCCCNLSNKNPHVCPACHGKKVTDELKTKDLCECGINYKLCSLRNLCGRCRRPIYEEYKNCIPCDGRGIVWEP